MSDRGIVLAQARMAIAVETTADTLRLGNPDERRQRRLRIRLRRLNETALLVQAQIEDRVNPSALWPGVSGEDLALWLFDAELTVERLAIAGTRAALSDMPAAKRAELATSSRHDDVPHLFAQDSRRKPPVGRTERREGKPSEPMLAP